MLPRNINGGPLLVDLTLQGGGAHDAFTWVALDCLRESYGLRCAFTASPALRWPISATRPSSMQSGISFLSCVRIGAGPNAFLQTYGAALGKRWTLDLEALLEQV